MKKQSVKIIVDVIMTVLLLLLMAFELIGRTAHEWFGVGLFVWIGHYLAKMLRDLQAKKPVR